MSIRLGDSWGILFSQPADCTPVCTTELGLTARLRDEFARRGVKAIALSVDPVDSHLRWTDDLNETQHTQVNFPILADAERKVAGLYDLIQPNANDTLAVRSGRGQRSDRLRQIHRGVDRQAVNAL